MSGTHLVYVKSFILPPRHLHQKDSHLSDGELWLRGEAVCPRSLPTRRPSGDSHPGLPVDFLSRPELSLSSKFSETASAG